MVVDSKHYAICLRGTWHLVTERTVGEAKVKELWQRRTNDVPAGYNTGAPMLRCLNHLWDYVSRMH